MKAGMDPAGKVGYAMVRLESLPPAPGVGSHPELSSAENPHPAAGPLLECMVAGTQNERYGRLWRMGQWRVIGDRYIYGRIGFEKGGELTELWDPSRRDFVVDSLRIGQTSPFVIDSHTLAVVYQLRPGRYAIKHTTFTANLQALLNIASDSWRWRVAPFQYDVGWDQWTAKVLKVIELRLKMLRPNPSYANHDWVEELIEGTEAHVADLRLQSDDGLDLSDRQIVQALEHVSGYGSKFAKGIVIEDGSEEVVTYSSDAETVRPSRTVEVDESTLETQAADLIEALGHAPEVPPESETPPHPQETENDEGDNRINEQEGET